MHIRLLLIAAAVVGIILALRWLANAPPAQVKRVLKRAALIGGIGLLGLLAVTGRLHWLFAAAAAAVPLIRRLFGLLHLVPLARRVAGAARSAGGGSGPGPSGQRSEITTRFIHMTLDHDTGQMDGTVLEGAFKDRRLSAMDLQELRSLLAQCRAEDQQSAEVLEAYLDRTHADWRAQDEGETGGGGEDGGGASTGPMTRKEALEILGLTQEADEQAIREAHRRLMQKLHPDRGGSDYLAAKINQAKDLLLQR